MPTELGTKVFDPAAELAPAPVIYDMEWAYTLWGFFGGAPADLVSWRSSLFRGAGEDYWQHAAPAHAQPAQAQPGHAQPGHAQPGHGQADPGYQGAADYANGHGYQGQHGQADYLPSGYPAGPQQDSRGYAPEDPYGHDESRGGYGGYPGYGAAER